MERDLAGFTVASGRHRLGSACTVLGSGVISRGSLAAGG